MRSTAVRNLGDIGLRVDDLDAMREFYASVVGLAVWTELEDPPAVFLEIADGTGGTRGFWRCSTGRERRVPRNRPRANDCRPLRLRDRPRVVRGGARPIERRGRRLREREFPKRHFRSFFFDPEGNAVEFVAYDELVDGDVVERAPDAAERGR